MLERFRGLQEIVLGPVGRFLVRRGISPDVVTWTGALLVTVVALVCFPSGWLWQGAVLVAVFLGTRTVGGSKKCRSAYPASPLAAAGAFAAMAGIGITTVMGFGEFSSRLHLIIWVLGLCSAVCMGIAGFCRLTGKTPTFLLYAVLCVYFALRMVSGYQNWSADPQLQDYCYYLLAYVTLMLTAYHHAAFHVGVGKHRSVWFFSLMAMYFCIVSLLGTTELYLLLGCGIWAFTNTTRPRARHYRQQRKQDPDGNENSQ